MDWQSIQKKTFKYSDWLTDNCFTCTLLWIFMLMMPTPKTMVCVTWNWCIFTSWSIHVQNIYRMQWYNEPAKFIMSYTCYILMWKILVIIFSGKITACTRLIVISEGLFYVCLVYLVWQVSTWCQTQN